MDSYYSSKQSQGNGTTFQPSRILHHWPQGSTDETEKYILKNPNPFQKVWIGRMGL